MGEFVNQYSEMAVCGDQEYPGWDDEVAAVLAQGALATATVYPVRKEQPRSAFDPMSCSDQTEFEAQRAYIRRQH